MATGTQGNKGKEVWCLDRCKEMMDTYKDGKVRVYLNNIFLYGAI